MIKVLEVPLSEDLSEFAEFLWMNEIPHRILERDQQQQLWVAPSIDSEKIVALFQMWKEGADLRKIKVGHTRPKTGISAVGLPQIWLTVSLILVSLGITFLIGMGENFEYFRLFTMTDIVERNGKLVTTSLSFTFTSGEWWRLITPVFIHFSVLHIIFNLLWVWIVGSKIEYFQGRWALAGLVLFSGISSNLAQFYISGPLFGGMSGVVFALLGYAWLWDRRNPSKAIGLPPALLGFMVVWLVLGYSGLLEGMGLGAIANTAHLAGLIAGLVFVPIGEMVARPQRKS